MAKDEKNKKSKEPKKSFLKDSKSELKKVNWPKPKRLATDTATVIVIVLIVAIIVVLLDLAFLTLNEKLVVENQQKIKDSQSNSIIVENIDTTDATQTENTENTEINENTSTENNQNTQQDTTTDNTEQTENTVAE